MAGRPRTSRKARRCRRPAWGRQRPEGSAPATRDFARSERAGRPPRPRDRRWPRPPSGRKTSPAPGIGTGHHTPGDRSMQATRTASARRRNAVTAARVAAKIDDFGHAIEAAREGSGRSEGRDGDGDTERRQRARDVHGDERGTGVAREAAEQDEDRADPVRRDGLRERHWCRRHRNRPISLTHSLRQRAGRRRPKGLIAGG